MKINTNVAALNAQRILGGTSAKAADQIGKLSSGFRINSAKDDAAGLGIANTLRANVRSLQQASRNAEQANALLQVAEGATQTIGNILDRMKELAAQAASSNSGDRTALHAEFNTLRTEIDRIVDTTKYQGTGLIDGTLGTSFDAGSSSLDGNAMVQAATIAVNGTKAATYTITKFDGTHLQATDGSTGNVEVAAAAANSKVNFAGFGISFTTSGTFDISGAGFGSSTAVVAPAPGGQAASFLVSSSGQYGTNDLVNLATAINLDSTALTIAASDLSTQGNAQTALGALDTAISTVNTALATIGGTQNRVAFASENVKSTIQNFQAAESTIRDADMAAEMTEFTKQQILQQAGVAMLSQANSAPQMVLKLLG